VDLSGKNPGNAAAGSLLFREVDGSYIAHLSGEPAGITWSDEQNAAEGYQIAYPKGWIVRRGESEGHPFFSVYPPGTDLTLPSPDGPAGITVTWTANYVPPSASDDTIASRQQVTIDGVTGETYTVSVMDQGMVAAFPWQSGTLLITGDGGQDLLIDVFQHMVDSLGLNGS
jgi:hypothetical protein